MCRLTGITGKMSNDRLYMRCKECGELRLFAKYSPSGSYVWAPELVDDWVGEHMDHFAKRRVDLEGELPFDFFMESREE